MATKVRDRRDPNTLSNYDAFRTVHTSVDVELDFERKILSGTVTLKLESIKGPDVEELVLDSSYLDVVGIEVDGAPAEWQLSSRTEPYGSALHIQLPSTYRPGAHLEVKDTPDVKTTFDFRIKSPLPVVASGILRTPRRLDDADGALRLYEFKQDIPIPTYLFAIASGDIVGARIGPRSLVYTGPDELSATKWELERDTEKFLQIAENLVYPYAWHEYNVLVLPPSFPYGGMENPVVTFATPTIISGDRENVDVIAHEISHSWSGNLVTNASWEHFWLNEGWTTYLERRIAAELHGEAHRHFSAIIGWSALTASINSFGEDNEFTKLVVNLDGRDPDDAFSSIPYEKGHTFLFHLEKRLGKDKWDAFIIYYFKKYRGETLDSYEFKSALIHFFAPDAVATKSLAELDWDYWYHKPGFPPKPDFDTSLVDACYELAERWKTLMNDNDKDNFSPSKSDIAKWTANQLVVFLERLSESDKPLRKEHVELMGDEYELAQSKNVEIVSRYFVLGLLARDEAVYQPTADLLGKVGRMKFVRPLYRHLKEADRDLAIATFEEHRDFYHPICRGLVEKDIFGG
ncbi:MAG: hypothetical protein M1825_002088 [Sarcosagium campestre]|nr:MAG: hypothetical protein M1825_002088 [Sarcosagium campestre]